MNKNYQCITCSSYNITEFKNRIDKISKNKIQFIRKFCFELEKCVPFVSIRSPKIKMSTSFKIYNRSDCNYKTKQIERYQSLINGK